jgi:amidohydrolase
MWCRTIRPLDEYKTQEGSHPTMNREQLHSWLIEFRRDLHRHPELSGQEVRTTSKITGVLEELGLEVETFTDLTGCTGLLRGKKDGPVLGLRADLDALPMTELAEVGYRSQVDGVMHSCGHDGHAAILLGAAKHAVESDMASQIKGAVKFIFQPDEEGDAGAKKMLDRGVLDNPRVDWIIGCHLFPDMEVGRAGICAREAMASVDAFSIDIQGVGGHGSQPDETRDPILAAGHIIVALQSIVSRNLDPTDMGVITVGTMSGGTADNIIPQSARLGGTIRAFSHETRQLLLKRLQEVAVNTGKALGVECAVSFPSEYPPLINDAKNAARVQRVLENVLGKDKVEVRKPIAGSEDFSYFAMARPAAYFFLGSGNQAKGIVHPPHSPHYAMDEDALILGVDIYAAIIKDYLG